ncbi:hypothetical protein M3599_15305 [Niallia circulans]|uniref:hypothetical protein n=1 Tax=Niallia circulans TaxID=1397 RepID=UPI00203B25AF|nr:hypothetical protein [Niallia circulans]MCM2982292.1 hypothetical protein [Niallia circulans]
MISKAFINDVHRQDYYIEVKGNYFKISDSKEAYNSSKNNGKRDDTIIIQVGNKEASEVFTVGVEDGERFALALLNLCYSIKY